MWMQEQYLRCPNCSTRREEWLTDKGVPQEAYVAVAERCPGCERLEWEMQAVREDSPNSKGMHYKLVRPEHLDRPSIPRS